MIEAKKLWQKDEQQTIIETQVQPLHIDKKVYNLVKLLIVIILYYAIIFL